MKGRIMMKLLVVLSLSVLLTGCEVVGWFIPPMRIYLKETNGKALLIEAEQTRQIKVEEAKAKKQSAQYEADAEVIRAKGVAEANKIIGKSLKDNEGYLRYLWIQGLQDGSSEVIYIPTEAGLPLLEAGKRK